MPAAGEHWEEGTVSYWGIWALKGKNGQSGPSYEMLSYQSFPYAVTTEGEFHLLQWIIAPVGQAFTIALASSTSSLTVLRITMLHRNSPPRQAAYGVRRLCQEAACWLKSLRTKEITDQSRVDFTTLFAAQWVIGVTATRWHPCLRWNATLSTFYSECQSGALLLSWEHACLSSPIEFRVKMQAKETACLQGLITN